MIEEASLQYPLWVIASLRAWKWMAKYNVLCNGIFSRSPERLFLSSSIIAIFHMVLSIAVVAVLWRARTKDHPYLWPQSVTRLALSLELSSRGLYALNGWLGVGKSQALLALKNELSSKKITTLYIKIEERAGLTESIERQYQNYLLRYERVYALEELQDLAHTNRAKFLKVKLNRGAKDVERASMINTSEAERKLSAINFDLVYKFLPKDAVRRAKENAFRDFLRDCQVLLIDLPDYPRGGKQVMSRDLDHIQKLWNNLALEGWDGNIVISIQRELLGEAGVSHYLLGKTSIYEIKPFSSSEILELYKMKWNSTSPFTEDALKYVCAMARGITRRWLRYLGIILQSWLLDGRKPTPMDIKDVSEYLPMDEVAKDMDTELTHVFRKGVEGKKNAMAIITLVNAADKPLNQKQVASTLKIGEMECSRIVDKLEDYGYLKREKTKEGNLLKTLF